MSWIDIGTNLTSSQFRDDRAEVITRALAAGVEKMLVISSDLAEAQHVNQLCAEHPQALVAAVGVHPHHASSWQADSAPKLRQLAQAPQVVAIGECGLDFNRNFSEPAAQLTAFAAQLELAVELQLPVYCHCRDAFDEFWPLIRQYRAQLPAVLLHCFTGSLDDVTQANALDVHLGVTGWLCDERRGDELRAVLPHIRADLLHIETDCPYLLPRDLTPKPSSRRNEPQYLPHIAHTVAQLRQVPLAALQQQLQQNFAAYLAASQHHRR